MGLGGTSPHLVLARTRVGIFPLAVLEVSLAGVTCELGRDMDVPHFCEGEEVELTAPNEPLDNLLAGRKGRVVRCEDGQVGVRFATDLDMTHDELCALIPA